VSDLDLGYDTSLPGCSIAKCCLDMLGAALSYGASTYSIAMIVKSGCCTSAPGTSSSTVGVAESRPGLDAVHSRDDIDRLLQWSQIRSSYAELYVCDALDTAYRCR
jgi:hypothetical protein